MIFSTCTLFESFKLYFVLLRTYLKCTLRMIIISLFPLLVLEHNIGNLFLIQRKFHVKKVRLTIFNNLYGVHNIIASHTPGPFDLRFSSCTPSLCKLPECLSNASCQDLTSGYPKEGTF